MLYVTTRNSADTHTAHQALQNAVAPDGGLYVPFRLPRIHTEMLLQMRSCSVSEIVAQILNLFFPAKLTAADVDESVGENSVRLVGMSHKIVLAELWYADRATLTSVANVLLQKVLGAKAGDRASDWALICCRIAYLFAVYGRLLAKGIVDGIRPLDIAVASDDFSAPMAAWYAREMGLPIGFIVCGCEDNSDVWDLINRKELRCDRNTVSGLERLVYSVLGQPDAQRFGKAILEKRIYAAEGTAEEDLGQGMFAAVVSAKRVDTVIRSVYRTNSYILSPGTALAYGGLQDYRATNGESTPALILAENGPQFCKQAVAASLGIAEAELEALLPCAGR